MVVKKIKYEERIVSFVDILGFAEKVTTSTKSNLNEIVSQVESFRSSFQEGPKPKGYEKDVIVISFSDSITRAKRTSSMAPVFYEVLSYVHGIADIVNRGYFVRGGMTYGEFAYHDKANMLISPAFVQAYKLESQHAKVPRVIVDPKLLEEFKRRKDWRKDTHTYKDEAAYVYKMLRLDSDGFYFIDYLKAIADEFDNPPFDFPDFVLKHRTLVVEGLKKYSGEVKKKYIWLGNYHNQVISEFHGGPNPDGSWDMGDPIPLELLKL